MSEYKRVNSLKNKLELLYEKLFSFEKDLVITSSPIQKFELKQRIQECEEDISKTKLEISNYEQNNTNNVGQSKQSSSNFQNRFIINNDKSSNNNKSLVKDVFICHASEDKQQVVEPLVHELKKASISCWYDNAEIKWGDSITKKVNQGLSLSRFVIVVLSLTFINKNWPQQELYSALEMESSSGEVKVLPLVFINNKREQQHIFQKLPLLRSKLHLIWKNNPQEIINELLKIL